MHFHFFFPGQLLLELIRVLMQINGISSECVTIPLFHWPTESDRGAVAGKNFCTKIVLPLHPRVSAAHEGGGQGGQEIHWNL